MNPCSSICPNLCAHRSAAAGSRRGGESAAKRLCRDRSRYPRSHRTFTSEPCEELTGEAGPRLGRTRARQGYYGRTTRSRFSNCGNLPPGARRASLQWADRRTQGLARRHRRRHRSRAWEHPRYRQERQFREELAQPRRRPRAGSQFCSEVVGRAGLEPAPALL